MPAYLVLTSPAAGNTEEEVLEPALAVLREAGAVEVTATGSAEELDAALQRRDGRTLVVAGGDGSLHAVVNGLHRRDELDATPLGLLPLGTGNDFARGLDLPTDPAEAARVIVTGTARPLDLLLDEDDGVVVNSAHTGAGAEAARAGHSWKQRWGRAGYAIGAVRALIDPPEVRLRVEVDGEEVCTPDDRVLQVAIGNGRYVGGGAPLTPEAEPDDGYADILVASTRGLGARLAYAAGMLVGRHHERTDVTALRGRSVRISGEEFWCSEDGELTGPYRERSWRLLPAAYAILVGTVD
ncbi:diacylglycerol kinase family protein [Nocardioides sp. BP30]|uniref:diacylglycerol/lipid kinase family protein n=1 Tax=Nocardioides sp. BP30 TaxID=3036374 RepID=UPI002468AEBC|nr:diacylglycerol kinase family protein [Nocardioides sp. BP30]WGL52265.1 diacylglycerol kinase family protein [Nocardioides sp. BP30]